MVFGTGIRFNSCDPGFGSLKFIKFFFLFTLLLKKAFRFMDGTHALLVKKIPIRHGVIKRLKHYKKGSDRTQKKERL